ncbi:MAG: hypothetical protein AAGA66_16510, partial [Bacteroidota bacterium]
MEILRVQFSAYKEKTNQFSHCFILIQEVKFSIPTIYQISLDQGYSICSEVSIDLLIEDLCEKENGEFWQKYLVAVKDGFSFTEFSDMGTISMNSFRVPRFGEEDFEYV